MRSYYVYIITNFTRTTLYIGITGDLESRIQQHRQGVVDAFTRSYKCHVLLYYEEFQYVLDAIEREKQLKRWSRKKKEWLIHQLNPERQDLAAQWE